ncbi:hypothetical protein FRACYDRAFT_233298 [Fragilariopsis cylindrus CCMP1102]|uniref:Integral membrane bound transporter domain-containing protein n=1 Tax=Fragilariopsis cylindrus CCMP1102 TaxID=635003 RepID=A0A1E7FYA4_9STRA|nr:hypothetical protein FRACYDRAFT_233298 [Fragilariopsis cylindrus CCMP1102]|eukprot:OEU23131.1 hypothetical protein FRACYDRAFT_233298 [Fragilariopsis cylindrus CCMP1102]
MLLKEIRCFSDLEIGPPFWERVDHALRITMATVYNSTMIIWVIGSESMPFGFLGLVFVVAFEPIEQSAGACIRSIPLLWRSAVLASFLGILGSLIFRLIIISTDDGKGELICRILFPFVAGFTAFVLTMLTWVPQLFNGLAMILPLPTVLKSSTSISKDGKTIFYKNCCRSITLRPALALPKVDLLISDGRKICASTIGILSNLEMTEKLTRQSTIHSKNKNVDKIVATYERLTSVRVMIERLEQSIIPQIISLRSAAEAELQLLLIGPFGCNSSGSSVESITNWLQFFRSILPTLQFVSGIVSAKHRDEASKDITYHEQFLAHATTPLQNLSRALQDAIISADKQSSVTTLLQKANIYHTKLLEALSDHRYYLFYKEAGVINDNNAIPIDATREWNLFIRDVALVHGMSRLTAEVAIVTHSVRRSDNGEIRRPDNSTSSFGILVCWLRNLVAVFFGDIVCWLRNLVAVFFGDIEWKKPFKWDRELLMYSFSFCVHIFFATLWYAIPQLDDKMNNEGLIVSITTCFIAIGKFGRSFSKSIQRILGTAVAIIWSVFLVLTLQLTRNQAMIATFPYIFICLLLLDRKRPYPMDCAAFTAIILLFQEKTFYTNDDFLRAVTFRMSTVGIGVIQFIVVEMLLFRSSARVRLEDQCVSYFHIVDDVFDNLTNFSSNLRDMPGEEEEADPIMATPEKDSKNKKVYHHELNILHRMIENVSLPLKNLVKNSERPQDTDVAFRAWINNLRQFKTSSIEETVQAGFDHLVRFSSGMRVTDKAAMVEQAFVLQLCAVSRSLSEICTRFQKTIVCFENIASERPSFFNIITELEKINAGETDPATSIILETGV